MKEKTVEEHLNHLLEWRSRYADTLNQQTVDAMDCILNYVKLSMRMSNESN
jgi:hypothetical protein